MSVVSDIVTTWEQFTVEIAKWHFCIPALFFLYIIPGSFNKREDGVDP